MTFTLSVAVLAQALASTPSVPAEPPPTQQAPYALVTHEWYGYQTLAVDGAALSLAAIGIIEEDINKQNQTLLLTGFVAGAAAYALGAPVVHVVHGRVVVGLADLGIRTGSGLLGTLIAGSIIVLGFGDPIGPAGADAAVGIFAAGLLVPMIIDAAVLSSATVVHYPDRPTTISSSWSFAPFVTTVRVVGEDGRHGAAPMLGIGGTF